MAEMEYGREGILRSEGKREYLVLGSQELLENSRRRRDGEEKGSDLGSGPGSRMI